MLITKRFFSNQLKRAKKPWEASRISYNDLMKPGSNSKIMETIEKAYSKEGLGVVLISDIPNFKEMNTRVAKLTNKMTKLPQHELEEVTGRTNEHKYLVGWSMGQFEVDGELDPTVGSFWAYPNFGDRVPLYSETETVRSLWPKSLPETQGVTKWTSEMIMENLNNLGRHVDFYLDEKLKGKWHKSLEAELQNHHRNIHRMGYYYPTKANQDSEWIGFHCDYTIFTGLCPNVHFNKEGEVIEFNDPNSGLFVMNSSTYEIEKIDCPPDCLAIQAGEQIQILSGGEIMPTPHGVLPPSPDLPYAERAVYILFTYFTPKTLMSPPQGKTMDDVFLKDDYPLYDYRHLRERWVPGEPEQEFFNRQCSYFFKSDEERAAQA